MVMKSFDRFPEKPQVAGSVTSNYYDPIEIINVEDEVHDIVDLEDL